MNDLEICKRIAEIEGYKWDYSVGANKRIMLIHERISTFDPIKNKALCFDLMVKHDVRVEPSDCSAWIDNEDCYPEFEVIHHEGTLQEAICLAIIKAHEQH